MPSPAALRAILPAAVCALALAADASAQQAASPTESVPAQPPASAAKAPRLELGLTALQGGVFEGGQWRGRLYDAVEVRLGAVRVGHWGLNEAGPDYRFGQNTLGVGLASAPGIALIAAAKHDNACDCGLALASSGIGVRLDDRFLTLPWGLFYNLQLFKNTGHGSGPSHELEGILLLGRTIAGSDLTLYIDWQRHADPYLEIEAVSPSLATTAGMLLRLWARLEGTDAADARLGAGLHLQAR